MVLCCSRHMFVRPTLSMDQAEWTARARRGVRVLRRRPGPAGPGQPQDRGRPARPLRPEDQPGLCGAGRALRHPGRPGPRAQAEGQAQVERPMPYVRDSFWRGREFASLERDAGRRAGLVPRRRRRAGAPPAGRGGPGRGVRRDRAPGAGAVAARRRSCWPPGRSAKVGPDIHVKVGPTLYSLPWRLIGSASTPAPPTTMVQFFHHGRADQDPPASRNAASAPTTATTRRRRSPSTCAPRPGAAPGRRGRPGLRGRDRRAARRERAVPAARRPRRARPGATSTAPAGSRPPARRPPTPATRPTAPSRASSPPAPRRPRPAPDRGRRGAARTCTAPSSSFAMPVASHVVPTSRRRHPPAHRARRRRHDPTTTTPAPAPPPRRAAARPSREHPADRPDRRGPVRRRRRSARPSPPHPPADRRRRHRRPRHRPGDRRVPPPPRPVPLTGVGGDPADHAALLARKAELFARIADQHAHAATGPPSTAAPTTRTKAHPMSTPIIDNNALTAALRALKLAGMLQTLDARLAQARAGELGHLEFLQVLCDDEICPPRVHRASPAAPAAPGSRQPRTLEGFDFAATPKLPAAQIRDLAALRWLARRRVRDPLRAGRRRQDPHRPGPRPPRHPRRRRGPLRQDQPAAGRPRRRPRRPHLGPPATRATPAPPCSSSTTSPCASSPPAQADDLYELISERAAPPVTDPHLEPRPGGLVSAVPQPRRRRVPARPADQHQPPALHERPQLPTPQTTRARRPPGHHDTPINYHDGPDLGELRDHSPGGIT